MELKIRQSIEKTDILIVGGGIAGLQAAITAGSKGANVIVAEKAHAKRSGSGSTGNDHFLCYIPSVHGDDIEFAMREIRDTMDGAWQDPSMLRTLLANSEDLIEKWQSYGIDMKPTGSYHFEGHTLPGRNHYHLKFDGRKQKECLYNEAVRQGAVIHNHITICDLLTDDTGKVIGAVGLNSKDDEPEIVVYQAKAVILANGGNGRAFPSSVPAYLFNTSGCPACTGGVVVGYRAGAKLVNYDILGCHAGPRYFERSGKATWIGMLSDSEGKPAGPFVSKPSREYGDPMSDIWPGVFADKLKDGTAPVYMNCTTLSDEDIAYMRHCFETEGISSVNDYLDQHNIDLRKSMIEFGSYGIGFGLGGLDTNEKAETNIKGLYGAGTAIGNVRGHITSAAVFGKISGQSAAEYVIDAPEIAVSGHPLIEKTANELEQYLKRENGGNWHEANVAVQQIMKDYIGGEKRSKSMLDAGLKYIRDLRKSTKAEISCRNAHELVRSTEVFDIIDLCEVAALMAENRKETRGAKHNRPDYPFTNPLLNEHLQTIQKTERGVSMKFRPIRREAEQS